MTNAPINLNRTRKTRAKEDRKAQADANAVRFGRTKAQKTQDLAEAQQANRHLSGHLRDPK